MRLYISDGALWVLLVLYTPLARLAIWLFWHRLPRRTTVRVGGLFIAIFIAVAFPLWDVFITSARMARVCPNAELKIYKTLQVDGYLTDFGYGENAIQRGFSYMEKQTRRDEITIYAKRGHEVVKTVIDPTKTPYTYKSQYEYRYGESEVMKGALHMTKSRSVVVSRTNGDILGEAVVYTAFPGWVDRNTIQRFGNMAWSCPTEGAISVKLLNETLYPIAK